MDTVTELSLAHFFRAGAAQHGATKECAERSREGCTLGVGGAKPYDTADERSEWECGEEPSKPEMTRAEEELFETFGALSGVVFIAYQTSAVALVEFAQPEREIRDLPDARRVGRRWDGCGWAHNCWRFDLANGVPGGGEFILLGYGDVRDALMKRLPSLGCR